MFGSASILQADKFGRQPLEFFGNVGAKLTSSECAISTHLCRYYLSVCVGWRAHSHDRRCLHVHVIFPLVLNLLLRLVFFLQDDDSAFQDDGHTKPVRSLAASFPLHSSQRPSQDMPRVDLSQDRLGLSSLPQSQSSQSSQSRLGRSQSSQSQRRSQMGF